MPEPSAPACEGRRFRARSRTGSKKIGGTFLKQFAAELKQAGLDSVNISLDSTDGGTYRKLTGADLVIAD